MPVQYTFPSPGDVGRRFAASRAGRITATHDDNIENYLWRPTGGRIVIAPGTTVRLTGLSTDKVVPASCVQIFADQNNPVTISVGPANLTVGTGVSPNIAYFQLDAGRSATIYTDDVLKEFFDMGSYFAAHSSADDSLIIYVTTFGPVPL